MIKEREKYLFVAITNIITAIAVFTIPRLIEDVKNMNSTIAVLLIFLLIFFLFNGIVLLLHMIRKEHQMANCTTSGTVISDRVVQMKEYYKLENLRREEEVSLEVKNYSIRTMAPYMSIDSIEFLCANIEGWTKSKGITLKPLEISDVLSSLDLRHFAWNIGERLGWTGQQRAQFIKQTFPHTLQDLEVETIRRNLRQKGTCLIKLDIPELGDFHFQP